MTDGNGLALSPKASARRPAVAARSGSEGTLADIAEKTARNSRTDFVSSPPRALADSAIAKTLFPDALADQCQHGVSQCDLVRRLSCAVHLQDLAQLSIDA